MNEIFNSIPKYTGEFIDEYLAELDSRKLLWQNKILLNESDLLSLAFKLEAISDPKYLNILKREIEIRGLEEKYNQQKNGN